MATRFYNTQSLLFTDEPFSDATVFPIIDYDYIIKNPIVGGELSFNSNAMVFTNKDGVDSNRLIVESNWRRQMIDGIGEVFTPFAQLRGDIYGVGGVDNQALNGSPDFVDETPDNGAILRGNALGGIEYRYPWMASTGSVTHVGEGHRRGLRPEAEDAALIVAANRAKQRGSARATGHRPKSTRRRAGGWRFLPHRQRACGGTPLKLGLQFLHELPEAGEPRAA